MHVSSRYVVLAVTDTGIGISPDLLDRIFEPYVTTKVGGGTGLGLAVVRGVVEQHGGTVRCDTQLGVGTTFEVLVPAVSVDEVKP